MSYATTTRRPRAFIASASLIGGAVSIAGGAVFGTTFSIISVRIMMARGMSVEQAYASLSVVQHDAITGLTLLMNLVAGTYGGYIAAKQGGTSSMLQALVAGLLPVLFSLVMSLAPISQPEPIWQTLYWLISPVVASLVGALLADRQT